MVCLPTILYAMCNLAFTPISKRTCFLKILASLVLTCAQRMKPVSRYLDQFSQNLTYTSNDLKVVTLLQCIGFTFRHTPKLQSLVRKGFSFVKLVCSLE
jgi:hypothetical protein